MAKRKRTYYRRRRPYKRRRTTSAASLLRSMAKLQSGRGPYGVENSATMKRYGPSDRQMMDNPGAARTGEQSMNRVMDRYSGPGDYMQAGEMIGGGVGSVVGGIAGMALTPETFGMSLPAGIAAGGAAGASIGGGIGHAIDEYGGRGDYRNQIAGGGDVISVNKNSRTGDIFIEQTEFIGNLTASATNTSASTAVISTPFTLEDYDINPGLSKLFPFLSQIATNYELYEWNGLMLAYKPNSGETSVSSNQLGKIIMATNYDPDAPDYRTGIEMQNYDYANSCKPSEKMVHGVETARKSGVTNMLYVRDNIGTKDRVLTDIGKLFIATEGIPIEVPPTSTATVVLGELHVTYRIRLSRAKLYQSLLGYNIASDRFIMNATSAPAASRGVFAQPYVDDWEHNTGTWSVDSASTTTTLSASPQLVAGCYKWVMYIKWTATVAGGSCLCVSGVTAGDATSVIPTTTSDGVNGDFIDSDDYDAAAIATFTSVAQGYFSVDNPSDLTPKFNFTLSANTGTTHSAIYAKLSVSQVSCRLEDAVF